MRFRCGRRGRLRLFAALHHLMAPVEDASQPAGRLDMVGGRGRLFAAVVVLAFAHFVFRQVVVIGLVFLRLGLLGGAFCQRLGPAGGILLVDGKAGVRTKMYRLAQAASAAMTRLAAGLPQSSRSVPPSTAPSAPPESHALIPL